MDIPLDKLPKQNHNQKIQTSKSQETKIKKNIKFTDSIDKLLDDKFLQLYFDNINNDSSKKKEY